MWGSLPEGIGVAHEVGHLLGLGDDYEVVSQNPRRTRPKPGRENTMMADGGFIDTALIQRLAGLIRQATHSVPDCWKGTMRTEAQGSQGNGYFACRTRWRRGPRGSGYHGAGEHRDSHTPEGRRLVKKRVVYELDVAAMGMPGSTGRRIECYRLGNWVCMTGQAAFTLDTGRLVGIGDPAAQARQCCENIKTLMEHAGGTMADLVKLTVYVTDRSYRAATYPVIRSYLREPRPCQTGVVVKGLAREDMLIEIDAWGFIDD